MKIFLAIIFVIQIIGGSVLVIYSAMNWESSYAAKVLDIPEALFSAGAMPEALMSISGIILGSLLIISGSYLLYLTFGRSGKD